MTRTHGLASAIIGQRSALPTYYIRLARTPSDRVRFTENRNFV
jgi:hypothetical protein